MLLFNVVYLNFIDKILLKIKVLDAKSFMPCGII